MRQTLKNRFGYLCLLLLTMWVSGCKVSFSPSSIAPGVNTFYVDDFKLNAFNAPATISQTFQEGFKDKVARESRLKFTEIDPHLTFSGTIQSYTVSAVAPRPDEQTSFNRLTIHVAVEYTNHLIESESWQRTFSHFADFPTDQDLLQVQDDLINVIFTQIYEDIFNQAFANW